jgi:hypothetical protein
MKRSLVLSIAVFAAVLLLVAQQQRGQYPNHVPFEMLSVFPREGPPGFFQHVDQRELQTLSGQGWELVSVMPFVYRNEERGSNNPKTVVTQTYPAYFFRREKTNR